MEVRVGGGDGKEEGTEETKEEEEERKREGNGGGERHEAAGQRGRGELSGGDERLSGTADSVVVGPFSMLRLRR